MAQWIVTVREGKVREGGREGGEKVLCCARGMYFIVTIYSYFFLA